MQDLMIYFALQEECQVSKLKKLVYTELHQLCDFNTMQGMYITSKTVFKTVRNIW